MRRSGCVLTIVVIILIIVAIFAVPYYAPNASLFGGTGGLLSSCAGGSSKPC